MMHLVQKQNCGAALDPRFRIRPGPFPETRKRGVRIVACDVDRSVAESLCDFEKQGRLAYLPRAS
jgi:hypothetical protein